MVSREVYRILSQTTLMPVQLSLYIKYESAELRTLSLHYPSHGATNPCICQTFPYRTEETTNGKLQKK